MADVVLPERTKGCCQPVAAPLPTGQADELARLCRAIADPTRVQIIHLSRRRPSRLRLRLHRRLRPRPADGQPSPSQAPRRRVVTSIAGDLGLLPAQSENVRFGEDGGQPNSLRGLSSDRPRSAVPGVGLNPRARDCRSTCSPGQLGFGPSGHFPSETTVADCGVCERSQVPLGSVSEAVPEWKHLGGIPAGCADGQPVTAVVDQRLRTRDLGPAKAAAKLAGHGHRSRSQNRVTYASPSRRAINSSTRTRSTVKARLWVDRFSAISSLALRNSSSVVRCGLSSKRSMS